MLQEKLKVFWEKIQKKAKRTCSFIRQFRVCRQSIPLWLRELHKMSLASFLLIFGIWQLFFEFNCSKLRIHIFSVLVKEFFLYLPKRNLFSQFLAVKTEMCKKNHNKCDVIFKKTELLLREYLIFVKLSREWSV